MKTTDEQPLFDEFGNSLVVTSLDEFVEKLRQIDWHRPSNETRLHEKRAILAWLWTRAKNELIEYPFRLDEAEKDPPDFTLQVGGVTCGIEVTQITTTLHRRASAQVERDQPEGEVWLIEGEDRILKPNDPPRGAGYAGDEPERQFATLVGNRVRDKCSRSYSADVGARLNSHSKNELLLYELSHIGIFVRRETLPLPLIRQAVIDHLSAPFSSVSIVKWSTSGWVLLGAEGPQSLLNFEDPSSA